MRILLAALMLVALTAGCVQPDDGLVLGEPQAAAVVPLERSIVAEAAFRVTGLEEHLHEDVVATGFQEDLELAVRLAGVHEVYDEFARPVEALVVQHEQQVLMIDDSEWTGESYRYRGHWEVHLLEDHFALADLRWLGTTDLATGSRSFGQASIVGPVGGGLAADLALAHALAAAGAVTLYESEGITLRVAARPYDGEAPLEGDCTMQELAVQVDPEPKARPADVPDVVRLNCVPDGETIPLWMARLEDGKAVATATRSGRLVFPALRGAALDPVTYDTQPWQAVGPALALPGLDQPVLAPPSLRAGDIAHQIARRIEASYEDPNFALYASSAGDPAVRIATFGVPSFPFLPLPDPTSSADSFGSVWVTGANGLRVEYLDTDEGDQPEQDEHRPRASNPMLPPLTASPFPVAPQAPLPAAGLVEDQLAPLLPQGRAQVTFFSIPAEPWSFAQWSMLAPCSGSGVAFVAVDAAVGQVVFVLTEPKQASTPCATMRSAWVLPDGRLVRLADPAAPEAVAPLDASTLTAGLFGDAPAAGRPATLGLGL